MSERPQRLPSFRARTTLHAQTIEPQQEAATLSGVRGDLRHNLLSLGAVASRASSNPHSKRRADSQDVPCVRLTGHSHVSRPHDDVEQIVTPTHDEIAVLMSCTF